MDSAYWIKQTKDQPAFPDLLWSRPETKSARGKLLIIGGNSFGFAAVGEAYATATTAGIGTARVLLPEAIRKVVGRVLEYAEYAASNPSGGFSKDGLGELLGQAVWADGVLLAGDFGKNSETAILLEQFLQKHTGPVTITKDAVDYFLDNPKILFERSSTSLVVSMGQLQKLTKSLRFPKPITSSMDLLRLIETLHELTEFYSVAVVVKHYSNILVGYGGAVSTTELAEEIPIWRVKTASAAAVWWLQNPDKPFEALTTSLAESGIAHTD